MDRRDLAIPDLSQLTFNDYVRHLNVAEQTIRDGKPLRVAILRSYTVEPIEPVLKLRLILDGFSPSVWFGGFNQYAQEILDNDSPLYRFRPDVVLLMTRIDEAAPEFIGDFAGRSASDWDRRITAAADEIGSLAARIGQAFPAQVIVQNMTLAQTPYFGVFDPQRPEAQSHLVHLFNRRLAAAVAETHGVLVWDFNALVAAKGYENLVDPKAWYVSRNPFKQSAYPAIVDDLMRYLRSALGRMKKCVVVDLDNTLWGGIAGEDGLEGIQLGHAYPGNCYRDFQQELLKLFHRGILLAVNSKNNEADALSIIDNHPDMVLRRRHFAAMRINWRDKAANLREIARELNVGVDSLIYVDDNPAECDLVRRECPDCDVVVLPQKPYLLPAIPSRLPGIENIRLTEEDRRKGEMYRAQAERRAHEESYSNLDDFLRSLQMEVSIDPAVAFSIPRIAQLTQKTNQMNMTTRRYTEAHIRSLTDDPRHAVFSVSSRDRFGDHGIIGVVILTFDGEECLIDTFLLSCRVIGRGIEQFMAAFIADYARTRDAGRLVGEFIATAKNAPAAGVYERLGFHRQGETLFSVDLRATTLSYPAHVRAGREAVARTIE